MKSIDDIMHAYKVNSYSSKEFGSKKVPTITTPDTLLDATKRYNEFLMKESNKLTPSYIVCFDSVKNRDILASKSFGNIPLRLILILVIQW